MRVLIAGLALLLAACGFQPMYAPPGGGNAIGPVQIAEIDGKAGHVLRTELNRILAETTGQPLDRIEKDTDRDYYLDGKGAVEYGLADKVLMNFSELGMVKAKAEKAAKQSKPKKGK